MTSPLEGSIASAVNSAFGSIFYAATLIRETVPTSPPSDAWDPTPTVEVTYTCKAIVESYARQYRGGRAQDNNVVGGLVDQNDRKLLVLANSLSVTPQAGDRVTLRSATYTVIEVAIDPAMAVWELRGRS